MARRVDQPRKLREPGVRPPLEREFSAGGLVYRRRGSECRVVLADAERRVHLVRPVRVARPGLEGRREGRQREVGGALDGGLGANALDAGTGAGGALNGGALQAGQSVTASPPGNSLVQPANAPTSAATAAQTAASNAQSQAAAQQAGGGTAQLPGGVAVYGDIPYAGNGPPADAGDTSTLSGPGPAVTPGNEARAAVTRWP